MDDPALQYAALIGSRICHDLISPIGAISNGLELMQLSGSGAGPEMDLIGESVTNANARIRLFRLAFGAAGDQMVGPVEVKSILGDAYQTGRHTVEWRATGPQPRVDVRLACLGIMCLEIAMPMGGTIRAECENDQWVLIGQAKRIVIDPDLWDMLRGQSTSAEIKPSVVQFALMPAYARAGGRRIDYAQTEEEIRLLF